MTVKSIIASLLLLSPAFAMERHIAVADLPLIADAANNEGGLVQKKLEENQLWSALHLNSDCPLQDAVTIAELSSKQAYPLRESDILKYNEPRANQSYLLTISWYLDNLRDIFKLKPETEAHMTVHVHRRSNGIKLINTILIPMLADFYNLKLAPPADPYPSKYYCVTLSLPHNTKIVFRNGSEEEAFYGYDRSYLVYSLGLVMGLNKDWEPGSLLLTETFIPTDETLSIKDGTKGVIYEDQTYVSPNHLKANLHTILEDEARQQKVLEIINSNPRYHSPNPDKPFIPVKPLCVTDFHSAVTLNIKTLYSPKISDPDFVIINNSLL